MFLCIQRNDTKLLRGKQHYLMLLDFNSSLFEIVTLDNRNYRTIMTPHCIYLLDPFVQTDKNKCISTLVCLLLVLCVKLENAPLFPGSQLIHFECWSKQQATEHTNTCVSTTALLSTKKITETMIFMHFYATYVT